MSDYFSSVEFENFGPIKKGTLKLTRLHALIGPNDSGKTSALRGMKLVPTFVDGTTFRFGDASLLGSKGTVRAAWGELGLALQKNAGGSWASTFTRGDEAVSQAVVAEAGLSPARMLRLDPDFLRQGAPLVTEGTPLAFQDERGTGLGSLLDAVFARNVRDYLALEDSLKALFPSVAGFRLYTDAGNRRIGIRLTNGTDVPAEYMSEGMLYFLAFAVLPYLSPVSVILVEEPENGLHPSRIAEVMRVLRKISETTQVVLATHSPLVVNELQPEEVTLVTRTPEEGTKFTPISETPNFAKRANAYALGELWLNYADGISEAALFKPTGS